MSVVPSQQPHIWADRDVTSSGHPVGTYNGHGVVRFSKFPGGRVTISVGSFNSEISGINVFSMSS